MNQNTLSLRGVRQHNLKNIDLSIDHDKFIVISGVSGSGKSSLAFDTIYAEGGRRYIETFSPYTRQFLDRLEQPDADVISGVRPAIALEQRNRISNSRSTVGTLTEINDYLKILWANWASIVCPTCNISVSPDIPAKVFARAQTHAEETKCPYVALTFPISVTQGASAASLRTTLIAEGFARFIHPAEKKIAPLDELSDDLFPKRKNSSTTILVLVERFKFDQTVPEEIEKRFLSSLLQAYRFGHDESSLCFFRSIDAAANSVLNFSLAYRCSSCHEHYPHPRPSHFSFNSPLGACSVCHGFGHTLEIDRDLCVPDPNLTINENALACWSSPSTSHELRKLKAFCRGNNISLTTPWAKLPQAERELLFNAERKRDGFTGIYQWFKKLERKKYKMHVRVFLSRYRTQRLCHKCGGSRLKVESQLYRVNNKTLPEVWALSIREALAFFSIMPQEHLPEDATHTALAEVVSRLRYLVEVGLEYLTLDRQARTLSGGEAQRVNLTTFLGTQLTNTMLVLDEPSIGLHQRDTARLIEIIRSLRDRGNSVLVVEHDTELIRSADEVIDLGPLAGAKGGEIVFQGSPADLIKHQHSITARYLRENRLEDSSVPRTKSKAKKKLLRIEGASAHNLADLDVSFPLNKLVVVTGVSGSGKSSLVQECIFNTYKLKEQGLDLKQITKRSQATLRNIRGLDELDEVVLVDQSPVGNTPRSNPATYTKAWEIVREAFAETSAATALGLSRSSFSFNVDGGRCAACKGAGYERIEMQFLADVYVRCDKCSGMRFQESVLGVQLGGKNVHQILNLTLDEALEHFASLGDASRGMEITKRLEPLVRLGLGYLKLGHPLNHLSGGEAQRVKLATYLAPSDRRKCLFIFDEPTTGLHPHDISRLVTALETLIHHGHSVLVIEHNMYLIDKADYIIDLGPEGGDRGGKLLAAGTPEELLADEKVVTRSYTLGHLKTFRSGADNSLNPPRKIEQQKGETSGIRIVGARHHNLRNVSVEIPFDKMTVITGVSGSGKSSLAFDILFAEGQRRYIDCLSPYARQFMTQIQHAEVDRIDGIPPTIAISQKTAPPAGITTLATTTEIYQYLRLLYAKIGEQRCPEHNQKIESSSARDIAEELMVKASGARAFVFAPVVLGRKGYYTELFERAYRAEIREAKIDGKIVSVTPDLRLERHKIHWISLLVAQSAVSERNLSLLEEAITQALLLGNGAVEIALNDKHGQTKIYSTERVCPTCKRGFLALDPLLFSFRSARGMCQECGGRGHVTDRNDEPRLCESCNGARIGPVGRSVYLGGRPINELTQLTAPGLIDFFNKQRFPERLNPIVQPIMRELRYRLEMMESIGLDYLALDRDSSTLSGGEAQRLRLTRALGSPLSGVCYVLDEPTIGLHPKDHHQLLRTLRQLRDQENTIVVVEHDEETIRAADYLIDVGPGGGATGGHIVATGSVADLERNPLSVTGQALRSRGITPKLGLATIKSQAPLEYLELHGAKTNNLKNVTIKLPLGRLTVVAGVSGAGKSSLVHGTLVQALMTEFDGKKKQRKQSWDLLRNVESLQRIIEIDQAPIGRTPSSTPISYLGAFDDIRKIFALVPEAKMQGWTHSRFSFNSKGGQCAECKGRGFITVPMSFLPNASVPCEGCRGLRYNRETLEVKFQGLSIGDLLHRTFDEAAQIFVNHVRVRRALLYVQQLGLGYLTLGQPSNTLSGGEAQRLKIAAEFGSRESKDTIYILDEPTTGLHMSDVDKLLSVLFELTKKGNTVLVIEHNLDFIKQADYLIELGPGPGDAGGEITYCGPPHGMRKAGRNSATKPFLVEQFAQGERLAEPPADSYSPAV